MSKGKKSAEDLEAAQAKRIFVAVGLVGAGLLTAAAIGLVMIRKKELLEEPDFDSLLGIGA